MKAKTLIASLVVTPLVAMFLMASPGFAATSSTPQQVTNTTSESITGGPLELIAPPSFLTTNSAFAPVQFSPVTLNGDQQTAQANLGSLVAVDATGTGEGWNITVSGGQFTEVPPSTAVANFAPLTLPQGSLKLAVPSAITGVAIVQGDVPTTSTVPNPVSGQIAIDNGSSSGTKVISAATKTGMGAYMITFPANALTLTLNPATTYVDTKNYPSSATPYTATLSWQINVGP